MGIVDCVEVAVPRKASRSKSNESKAAKTSPAQGLKATSRRVPPAASDGRGESSIIEPEPDPSLPDWKQQTYTIVRRYVGRRIALAIVFMFFVVVPLIWANRDEVLKWNWTNRVLNYVLQPNVPHAAADKYTVLVAMLEDDADGSQQEAILESLREIPGVEALRLRRMIAVDYERSVDKVIQDGTAAAQGYLKETGGNILLWGKIVTLEKRGVPKLYWTVSDGIAPPVSFGRYAAGSSNELPLVFWAHLSSVISLLVMNEEQQFDLVQSDEAASGLERLIPKIELLLDRNVPHAPNWDTQTLSTVRLQLANALLTVGAQRGSLPKVYKAMQVYKDVLDKISKSEDPVMWSYVQSRIGLGYFITGGWATSEGFMGQLEQIMDTSNALSAFTAALDAVSRDREPFSWALIQFNRAVTLKQLGEQMNNPTVLAQAISAYREILGTLSSKQLLRLRGVTQNNLGMALSVLHEYSNRKEDEDAAATAFRAALMYLSPSRDPAVYARSEIGIGSILASRGQRESNATELEEGAKYIRDAAQLANIAGDKELKHIAENYLDQIRAVLGRLKKQKHEESMPVSEAAKVSLP
ncbi:hypothetical protein BYI23_A001890 [Burkholderia sp. YI23]|nr:hypothetical protein BYI23_A001890 [Burkholderia sp. YI23]